MDWAKTTARGYKKHLNFRIWCDLYKRFYVILVAADGFDPCRHQDISNHHVDRIHVSERHYYDVIMSALSSQITRLTVVYSTNYSAADQRKRQSSASLAFVRGNHRGPVSSPHKWPVTRKMFPFDDVIMGRGVGMSSHSSNTSCIRHCRWLRDTCSVYLLYAMLLMAWRQYYSRYLQLPH